MKNFQFLTALAAVILLLGVAIGPALAQDEIPPQPEDVSLQGTVSNQITFQGSLTIAGDPVNGTPDMTFRLYSDSACTIVLGGTLSLADVPVTDGLFSVELGFATSYFNGQALWLRTTVNGDTVGCQEILPVPYALSLRPGADITSDTVDELLVLDSTATGSDMDTLIVRNDSPDGEAVEIAAVNTGVYAVSTNGFGVIGVSTSLTGAGIEARGAETGIDLVIGGNANTTTGDDGVVSSDPDYPGSDLFFFTNDGFVIRMDKDGNGEDADLEVRDKDNALIFNIDESGDVTMTNNVNFGGAGLTTFPRPAYDSGWITLGMGADYTLTHSLGGTIDNYVVDMTCKHATTGINNWGMGGDASYDEYYGAWYTNLTNTSIILHRWDNDSDCPQVRIRIWMYP